MIADEQDGTAGPRAFLGSPILGQLNGPNGMTLAGLTLALGCLHFSAASEFRLAMLCLIGAGLADLFDGYLARRSKRGPLEASVGSQLDSICDICSFGVAPAFFAYAAGLMQPWQMVILAIFVCAGALRLAYFNAVGLSGVGDKQFFTGMPVTYNALFVPVVFLVSSLAAPAATAAILSALFALLAAAMVAGVRIPKPTGVWYGIFGVLALVVGGLYVWLQATGR